MEDSGPISKEIGEKGTRVESVSLSQIFEEQCPIYMSYGMSYDEFWYDSPYRAKFYREAKKIAIQQKDEEMWMQGVYIYDALCRVSPILHAFSKSGTKPLPYPDKPYLSQSQELQEKEDKEKMIENERLKAEVQFRAWARSVAKQFGDKEVSHD